MNDVGRALRSVRQLAHRFRAVTDDDLNRIGWDDPSTRRAALDAAVRRGVLRPTERAGTFESTTFDDEE